jgi:hypothetical protein
MRSLPVLLVAPLLLFILLGCGAVPHVSGSTKCTSDFRNDTMGVLSDADLATAWKHAQWTVANGYWVINPLECDNRLHPDPPQCTYEAPNTKANSMGPECLGVKGTNGEPYPGADGVTDDSHNIAINIAKGHDRAWNLASYEMENCIGERLGFPMGNR